MVTKIAQAYGYVNVLRMAWQNGPVASKVKCYVGIPPFTLPPQRWTQNPISARLVLFLVLKPCDIIHSLLEVSEKQGGSENLQRQKYKDLALESSHSHKIKLF